MLMPSGGGSTNIHPMAHGVSSISFVCSMRVALFLLIINYIIGGGVVVVVVVFSLSVGEPKIRQHNNETWSD